MKDCYRIIEFETGHAGGIASVEKACFAEPWSAASLISSHERGDCRIFTAFWGDEIIGWAGMEHLFGEGSVLDIAVLPEHRREGVGEALTRRLIREAKALDLVWLTLEVRVSNSAAVSLYKKLGFTELGRRPNFYSYPREDALMMRIAFAGDGTLP